MQISNEPMIYKLTCSVGQLESRFKLNCHMAAPQYKPPIA
jgi:hypothetical protein